MLGRKATAIGKEVGDRIEVARNPPIRDDDRAVVERRHSPAPASRRPFRAFPGLKPTG